MGGSDSLESLNLFLNKFVMKFVLIAFQIDNLDSDSLIYDKENDTCQIVFAFEDSGGQSNSDLIRRGV